MAEEYVGVWWNGLRGKHTARRIYYLLTEHGHTVRAEDGTDNRRVRIWDLPDEEMARLRIADLMEPEEGDPVGQVWRETTAMYRTTK